MRPNIAGGTPMGGGSVSSASRLSTVLNADVCRRVRHRVRRSLERQWHGLLDDAEGDALLRLARRLKDKPDAPITLALIDKIARCAAIDVVRRNRRLVPTPSDAPIFEHATPAGDDAGDVRHYVAALPRLQAAVDAAWEALGPDDGRILIGVLEGESCEGMAQALQLAPAATRKRRSRAEGHFRQLLREALGGEEVPVALLVSVFESRRPVP